MWSLEPLRADVEAKTNFVSPNLSISVFEIFSMMCRHWDLLIYNYLAGIEIGYNMYKAVSEGVKEDI